MNGAEDGDRCSASKPPPLSPCIFVCRIDQASGLCTGCRRTMQEIATWRHLGDDEQWRILEQLPQRR